MLPRKFQDIIYWVCVTILAAVFVFLVLFTNKMLTVSIESPEETKHVSEQKKIFSDVDRSTPEGEAIYALSANTILSGYPDGTFLPNKTTSRVETLKALFNFSPLESSDIQDIYQTFLKQQEDVDFLLFKDIPKKEWFSPYIYKAYRLGMIAGNADGTFTAAKPVTYAEFLKMLLVMEREEFSNEDANGSPFLGIEAHQWYTGYFERAKKIGLLPLPDETGAINPNEELTRGKMAEILYKYQTLRTLPAQKLNNGKNVKEETTKKEYLEDVTGR